MNANIRLWIYRVLMGVSLVCGLVAVSMTVYFVSRLAECCR